MSSISTSTAPLIPSGSFVLPTPILTTTFTPPPACSTQFAERGRIILNPMFPPLFNEASACYEEQFVSWYTAFQYTSLVCPSGYQTQSVFAEPANYIACCPEGWDGLELWENAPPNRPAYLASCTSTLPADGLLVTYDALGVGFPARNLTTSTYTPTTSGEVAYAFPYDGIAVGGASVPASASSTPTGDSSGSGAGGTESPSGSAAAGSGAQASHGAGAGVITGAVLSTMLLFACLMA